MKNFEYSGEELGIFKFAINWKLYYKKLIEKFIKDGPVIEVGAGIGEITKLLKPLVPSSKWICIEPDKINANKILMLQSAKEIDNLVEIFNGTLEEFNCESKIASVVMLIDSLEHIEDDFEAIAKVGKMLKNNGILIIIVPAHNFLFSDFDKKIGHFRRYNKKMLRKIIPNNFIELESRYIDSAGFFLSAANRFLLKSSDPSIHQIKFWDTLIVPLSIKLDKIFNYRFGKNIVFIAVKN
jgi:ubiquinone/menaquinone biosynthesis C-methylase UbiE